MATLDALVAEQVDPGAATSDAQASKLTLQTPQQLYELWERQHWLSQDIDFTQDKRDFANLTDEQKDNLIWVLSTFFIGEERVTTQFSGLVMAYEDEHEESFLTTQQVDEARHMQFFDRFYREVIGIDNPDFDARLDRVREELNEAFGKLFDEALVEAGQRLIADPSDREAKVEFITTYHMVIEGALALTGQNFVTRYMEENDIFPGFVEGFGNVARDEHRHVAYGTWWLQQNAGSDDALAERMQARLQELIPVAAGVLVPPGADPTEEWQILGYSSNEVNEFAFKSLSRRLKAIGVPLQGAPTPA
ncbi:MAG: ribonucleotide reductase [uncultured Solirubrobacterales bacterium]|uniref:Ribonucleotide reductase n=1 Tax=uncultured Solirubrobacterales bacterium TaxID=768556 RepID=A0A6J4T2D1_9ACTN|nr:MAG: ribonucleotide reductase [uncultured Solirubrobacterales bacterium]